MRSSLRRPPAARPGRLRRAAAPLLIGVAAALIAGWRVARPALWRDEVASVTMAERDWPAFAGTIAHVDAVHALYYAGLHLWFSVVPFTPFTLRLPSVLAVGATAAVVVLLGRRLAGPRAGIPAGAAAAVLPSLVWAGGEGRSSAFTALLAAATTLALLHALGDHGRRRGAVAAWIGYGALLALTTVLFVDAALLGAAHLITMLLLGRRRIAAGLAALAGAALAASPLVLLATRQTGQVAWIRDFGPTPLWPEGVQEQWFRSRPVLIAWLVVLAIGLVVALVRRRPIAPALAVALPWALLPPVALVSADLAGDPLYWPRYVTFTAPAVALLAGALVSALPAALAVAALLVLALVAVPQVRADRAPRAKALSEMAYAAALVHAARSPADGRAGILYGQYGDVPGSTTRLEAIAYPAAFRGLTDLRLEQPLARSTQLFGANRSTTAAVGRAGGLRTIWILLDLDGTPKTFVPAAAMHALGFTETGRFRTTGSLLLRWTR